MKIVKSKLSIAVLSLGFVSVVGAVAYATLSRPFNAENKPAPKINYDRSKIKAIIPSAPKKELTAIKAPHQEVLEQYIDQVKSFMQTPPRDGVFGSDRVPTLHGKDSYGLESYDQIKNLEGSVSIRSVVLGLQPLAILKGMAEPEVENGAKRIVSDTDHIRISDIHEISHDREDNDNAGKQFDNQTEALQKFAIEIRKKGLDEDVQAVSINGKQNWIIAKAVHASVNSCYKCHANIKKGEPIGYVAALYSDDKK